MKRLLAIIFLLAAISTRAGIPYIVDGAGSISVYPPGTVTGSTISNAVYHASAGQTVVIWPGSYAEHNLLKAGVNYFLMPGVVITWSNTPSTDVWGIFDDRPVGATTNIISGEGVLRYYSLPPSVNGTNRICTTSPNDEAGVIGPVITTNGLTRMTARLSKIQMGTHAGNQYRAGVFSWNSAENHFDVDVIEAMGTPAVTCIKTNANYDPEDPDSHQFITNSLSEAWSGLIWGIGECYARLGRVTLNDLNYYSVWGHELNPVGTHTANLYVSAEYMGGNLYMDTSSAANGNYRSWVDAKLLEIPGGGSTFQGVGYYGGKHYLHAQKIAGPTGSSVIYANNASQVWIDAEKVTAVTGATTFMTTGSDGTASKVHLRVLHWEDLTGNNLGIVNSAGLSTVYLGDRTTGLTNAAISVIDATPTNYLRGDGVYSRNGNAWTNLSVNAYNNGSSASSSTFLRGDGTWATPSASATVTISASNFVSGTFYTNSSGKGEQVTCCVTNLTQAISGFVGHNLFVDYTGGHSFTAVAQFGKSTFNTTISEYEYGWLFGLIPSGACYCITNFTSGLNQASTLGAGTLLQY